MNFIFQGYNSITILTWILLVAGLIFFNEVSRRSKIAGITIFMVLPAVLTIWWTIAAIKGYVPSARNVFGWIKTYSALAGCIGFMFIRYSNHKWAKSKYILIFPAFILAFNILEAIFFDFYNYFRFFDYSDQVNTIKGFEIKGFYNEDEGLVYRSGPWNLINGFAGILNMITITGWFGIKISRKKSKDMIWSDQLWFWIIAYDLWNISYCYNNISTRAMYAGVALIVACTLAEFFIQRGAWLQHRAHTLAIFAMFSLSVPYDTWDAFGIAGTNSKSSLLTLSILALVVNALVFGFALYRIISKRLNPLKDELYLGLKSHTKNLELTKTLDVEVS